MATSTQKERVYTQPDGGLWLCYVCGALFVVCVVMFFVCCPVSCVCALVLSCVCVASLRCCFISFPAQEGDSASQPFCALREEKKRAKPTTTTTTHAHAHPVHIHIHIHIHTTTATKHHTHITTINTTTRTSTTATRLYLRSHRLHLVVSCFCGFPAGPPPLRLHAAVWRSYLPCRLRVSSMRPPRPPSSTSSISIRA